MMHQEPLFETIEKFKSLDETVIHFYHFMHYIDHIYNIGLQI